MFPQLLQCPSEVLLLQNHNSSCPTAARQEHRHGRELLAPPALRAHTEVSTNLRARLW